MKKVLLLLILLILADGKLVEQGAPDRIFDNPQSPRLQDFLSKVLI